MPQSTPELFTYTPSGRKAILTALKQARTDWSKRSELSPDSILSRIEALARRALLRKAHADACPHPYAGVVHKELNRLAADSARLRETINAIRPEVEALLMAELDTTRVFADLTARLDAIGVAAIRSKGNRLFQHKGPRRNEPMAEFVLGLAVLYNTATDIPPTRRIDESGRGIGPFHNFVEACVCPTGLLLDGEGVDHYVRHAIKSLAMESRDWSKVLKPGSTR